MFSFDEQKSSFTTAIRTRNIQDIISHIKRGTNINTDAGGIRVFEALLASQKPSTQTALNLVLSHPGWNPNYRSADTFHPEERAMLHKREDIALRIIQHPNFDKKSYPRVIQSAERFQADKVLQFFADQSHVR